LNIEYKNFWGILILGVPVTIHVIIRYHKTFSRLFAIML
jgi:hypothetical protein